MVDFLIQSITKSSKTGDPFLKDLTPELYYRTFKKIQILKTLKHPNTRLLIINRKEEVEEIKDLTKAESKIALAYLIFQGDLLYYTYTKLSLRRKNYFWKMLNASGIVKDNIIKTKTMTRTFFHLCQHKKLRIEHYPDI